MGADQKIVAYFLSKIRSRPIDEIGWSNVCIIWFLLGKQSQIPECWVNWSPTPATLGCCYLSEASIVTHPAIILVFQIGINESLVSHKVLDELWLLLAPHSNVNCKALQPLQYVGNWWLLCSCLRFFFIEVCTQPFRQQVRHLNKCSWLNPGNQFCQD